ncbi:MAG: hypothetical protein ABI396_05580 [Ktedonobacteraceae bacterium]
MNPLKHTIIRSAIWIAIAMFAIVVFHIGDSNFVLHVGEFSPLLGAAIGGFLALFSLFSSRRRMEATEPWLGNEQLAWILIGLGIIMWGLGESFWQYYTSIGQSPFPSLADIGYFSFPLLVFAGLLLQPPSGSGRKRLFLLLDSLISMTSILAIAWFLLLGSLAQAPGEANLAKFLGMYYPTADTALLSSVMFLLLRGQGRSYQADARRISLLVIGLGLCFFVFSDFIFNVQQNAGTYVQATWIDLGWPFGMITIGIAVYLRRFLPVTSPEVIEQRMQQQNQQMGFGPTQFVPYTLLTILLCTLTLNVLSTDSTQHAIRPVLLLATLGVVGLVVIRQILTLRDNVRLTQKQAEALTELAEANQRIAEQSGVIARHNEELEHGIKHLKDVQASLANGNLQARARLNSGALLSLAASLNLMADRLTNLWRTNAYAQRMAKALGELSVAVEGHWNGHPLVIPDSCNEIVEITRLLRSLRIKGFAMNHQPIMNHQPAVNHQSIMNQQPITQPLNPHSHDGISMMAPPVTPTPPLTPMSQQAQHRLQRRPLRTEIYKHTE